MWLRLPVGSGPGRARAVGDSAGLAYRASPGDGWLCRAGGRAPTCSRWLILADYEGRSRPPEQEPVEASRSTPGNLCWSAPQCPPRESNPHGRSHRDLNPACLPIPPEGRKNRLARWSGPIRCPSVAHPFERRTHALQVRPPGMRASPGSDQSRPGGWVKRTPGLFALACSS